MPQSSFPGASTHFTLDDTSWVEHEPAWVPHSDLLLEELLHCTAWEQEEIALFGRSVLQPRLTTWFGVEMDPATRYTTARGNVEWTARMAALRDRVSERCEVAFNACLANLYRDGNDSVAWHADDEPTLGPAPVVASVSLGSPRRFLLRERDGSGRYGFDLGDGDLLVMGGDTQARWTHSAPKTRRLAAPRVNLTFRRYVEARSSDPA